MSLYYELPIYKDVYKLIHLIYVSTKDFPREYKYSLGQDLKRDSLQLVRGISRVNKSVDKKQHFLLLLDDFELIKFQLRLCADLKLLSVAKQATLMEMVAVIGKQLTAWSKKY